MNIERNVINKYINDVKPLSVHEYICDNKLMLIHVKKFRRTMLDNQNISDKILSLYKDIYKLVERIAE